MNEEQDMNEAMESQVGYADSRTDAERAADALIPVEVTTAKEEAPAKPRKVFHQTARTPWGVKGYWEVAPLVERVELTEEERAARMDEYKAKEEEQKKESGALDAWMATALEVDSERNLVYGVFDLVETFNTSFPKERKMTTKKVMYFREAYGRAAKESHKVGAAFVLGFGHQRQEYKVASDGSWRKV